MCLFKQLSCRPWLTLTRRTLTQMRSMGTPIHLTAQEATLKQLLLDVAIYIGTLEGWRKPELRITGGWVRDKLLGASSNDVDVGIDTMTGSEFGDKMKQYLAQPGVQDKYNKNVVGVLGQIKANPEKSKHLETVTTKILGLEVDLVNLRKETYSEKSRNPIMELGTPQEDAFRRDATVNALFYNLSNSQVEDFTGRGLEDMKLKVIKTPLSPLQTFKDDPLRVLRCIRFASRLNYQIGLEENSAMSDDTIKQSLRLKISRERVGVEVTKMIKGPDPHEALRLIDHCSLYNTIFTDPTSPNCKSVSTERWKIAYDHMQLIIRNRSAAPTTSSSLQTLNAILLRNSDDLFLAWMLTCFIPWAMESQRPSGNPTTKNLPSAACIAAREGIKADNKLCRVVNDATSHLQDIIKLKDLIKQNTQFTDSSVKQDQETPSRESLGQSIRAWGSHWRSSVIFALLTQLSDSDMESKADQILSEYAVFLSGIQTLGLLDVDGLKPIINGKDIMAELGIKKSGPWLKQALDIVMGWQLRNPSNQGGADGAIAEVKAKRRELGLPEA